MDGLRDGIFLCWLVEDLSPEYKVNIPTTAVSVIIYGSMIRSGKVFDIYGSVKHWRHVLT